MANTTQLITLLSEKEILMVDMVMLLEKEQRHIVDMDIASVELVDEEKKALLVRMEDSSNALRQALKKTAGELNLPDDATLSTILPRIDARERSVLQSLQARLLDIGAKLDRALVFNHELLHGSLRMVDRSLQFFQGLFRRTTTYGYGGGMVSTATDVRLVCKEI